MNSSGSGITTKALGITNRASGKNGNSMIIQRTLWIDSCSPLSRIAVRRPAKHSAASRENQLLQTRVTLACSLPAATFFRRPPMSELLRADQYKRHGGTLW
jgi:hypothetical protein